jgi:hypothetical protein
MAVTNKNQLTKAINPSSGISSSRPMKGRALRPLGLMT